MLFQNMNFYFCFSMYWSESEKISDLQTSRKTQI